MIKNADSTNLLKLEKVIKTKNNLYIITEYCEGSDLAKILRKKKIFSEVDAQSIMKQLLQGYKELFRLKLIHRDLKLANLFITKGKIKIADFGFTVNEQLCHLQF
jgi:serine/threonine protein kinase